MSQRLKLTDAGEIDLTNGTQTIIEGPDALVQKLQIVLQFFVGDWFLDLNKGIPFFQQITRKNVNESDVFQIYYDVIANTKGVASVDELDLTFGSQLRRLDVSGKVTPITSVVPVSFNTSTVGSIV